MRTALVGVFGLLACSGPAASDAALCRDVIHRLCIMPVCDVVTQKIPFTTDCESYMVSKAGCGTEAFMFKAPLDRDTFLTCRLPLLRNGTGVDQPPDCLDVSDTFDSCPALVQFLGGTP